MSTTVFDLPDRLSAKADPALIADDLEYFAEIERCLQESIDDVTARLEEERLSPARHGAEALDRDRTIHQLTARRRALRRFGLDLCLGHIVPVDADGTIGAPIWIGRLGLTDRTGRRLLVDWRSPAAEPFFAATHGHPMALARRRRYRWTKGRITDYWDEVFVHGTDVARERAAMDDQSAFIAELASSRSSRMRDVLGTIQADQDAIIRAGSPGTLVVDGGPGTGKTVVALHRAAYLLYADPRLSRDRGGVLVVGPHHQYLRYVSDVLPALGEDGVQTCTLQDLLPEGVTARPEPDPAVARLKAGADLVRAVATGVRFYEEPPTTATAVETPWTELELTPSDWAEAFGAVEPGTPHNEARERIHEELVTTLVDRASAAGVDDDTLRNSLRRNVAIRDELHRAWPLIEATELVADLWSVPAFLRLCAPWLSPEQVKLLRRSDNEHWTLSDLPYLDTARQLLGDAGYESRRRAARAQVQGQQQGLARVVEEAIVADDSDMMIMSMLRGDDLQDALIDEDSLPQAERDPLAGPFAHVVVDEAQELTDAQWQMLVQRCPSGSFTVVGDRAQARDGFAGNWESRLERAGLDRITVASLTVNYRTPEEVMTAAAPVILAALPDANVPTSVRRSGIPVRTGELADLPALLDVWQAGNADGVACVIAAADRPAPTVPDIDRVSVLTPETAKGLEFDLVVLIDPDGFGTGVRGAVDRYVAMTRATRELVVLTS
ncbi:RNA polymerase recycling motor ATPase HelR [Nakamurella alba]|uniref:RNA polymerase recycling motor ATPase HelR n=1 Tax=Nakamurella alba TaxID=2665158 RepID=UPI0012B9D2AB